MSRRAVVGALSGLLVCASLAIVGMDRVAALTPDPPIGFRHDPTTERPPVAPPCSPGRVLVIEAVPVRAPCGSLLLHR